MPDQFSRNYVVISVKQTLMTVNQDDLWCCVRWCFMWCPYVHSPHITLYTTHKYTAI